MWKLKAGAPAFKIRGATNAVQLLSDAQASKGVVTHSSGNHAQALALAARQRGITAHVVMPRTSPEVKKAAVRGYGAHVVECEPTQAAREATARQIMEETGATFVHPYNHPHVMAGQGTIALEALAQTAEEKTPLDCLIVPVGGGGMLSGCSVATKSLSPHVKVFAAEPEAVNDTYRSFKSKSPQKNDPSKPLSVADGLLTNLGEIAFQVVMEHVDDVFVVTEEMIVRAMHLVWGRMKLCIEPSAAVGLAVALYNPEFAKTVKDQNLRRIGIVLCGGNVDFARAVALFQAHGL